MLLSSTQMISVIAVIPHTKDLFKRFYPPHRGSLLTLLSPTLRISLKAFISHTENLLLTLLSPTPRISFDAFILTSRIYVDTLFLSLTIHIHSKIVYVP